VTIDDHPAPIDGFPFPVKASPGCKDKALAVASRCAKAYAFGRQHLGVAPAVELWVLSHAQWIALAQPEPYGMPHFGAGTLFVAGEHADFWADLGRALDGADDDRRGEVARTYGRAADLDLSPFFDLLVVHELAHAFLGELRYPLGRHWLEELFCNVALHSYLAATEPDELDHLTVFPRAYLSLARTSSRRDLDYFEIVYSDMPPADYAWYQCRLHAAAADIHAARGIEAMRGLWEMGRASDELLVKALDMYAGQVTAAVFTGWPA